MWIWMLQRRLAALVLVCAAIGCGGGGGGGSPPPSGGNNPPPVDTSPPDTSVTEVHQSGTHSTNAITFTPSSEAGATFEGNLDGAGYVAISVPWNITGLADGDHTVAIRARDAAGNVDPSPFTFAWRVDATAPVASISFPLPTSATDATAITVRGIASDSSEITSIEVNGVDAQSDDGFATWSATIPLASQSATTLSITATDAVGHQMSSANVATVHRVQKLVSEMRGMDYDPTGNRIVVADRRTNTIYGFDADTGEATVISANDAAGAVPLTNNLEGLVIDAAENRALVVDSQLNALVAVDLDTGARTVVTNTNNTQLEAQFSGAVGVALDTANDRAFVGNNLAAIVEVNLVTGDRTVIARSMPGDPEPFFNPVSLAYDDRTDPANPRLLIADVSGNISKILALDPTNGTWGPFVTAGASLGEPIDIHLDADRNRLLIVDDRNNRLLAADLSTSLLSEVGANADGLGETIDPMRGITIRTSSQPKIFVGQQLGEVMSVDVPTRKRSTLVSSRIGAGARMPFVLSVAVEQSNGAATSLVASDFGLTRMIRIDLASGNRTTIANQFLEPGVPSGGIADLAIDRRASVQTPSALALLFGMQSLVSVDLANGQINPVADLDSAMPPVDSPWSMSLDAGSDRVFFISQDTSPSAGDSVYEIDLSSKARRTVADNSTGGGPALIEAVDLVLEPSATPTRAVVSDNALGALLWLDLASGDRSELTPLGQQTFRPGQLYMDGSNGRVIGYNHAGPGALFAADLESGSHHVISGYDLLHGLKGTGPLLGNVHGLDVDTSSQIAFVTDTTSGAVLAIDLVTGERVIVAH